VCGGGPARVWTAVDRSRAELKTVLPNLNPVAWEGDFGQDQAGENQKRTKKRLLRDKKRRKPLVSY
jgi:hypothetical protein